MTTIGYATLQIIPSLKGVSEAIEKQLAGVAGQGRLAGRTLGDNIAAGAGASRSNVMGKVVTERDARDHGARIGRVFGLAIGGAASAGIAGIGYTLTKGFERLQSIDQATFKLKALGHSAAETKQIMDDATASVKGTAFSLADAATAAAAAVAAGIKPGQDLTKYLTEVGDAAAIAGTNFDDMGHIFNKIQTQNKAFTDDLQMLSDRGVPIFQWLQKEYGVTGDALSKMVEKGQVDAAHFQEAVADNIGGSAQKMGQSFQGAMDNMETAIARVGAHFLGSIFGDKDGSQLGGPTEAITKLTEKFDKIDAWVQAHGPQIHQFFATMVDDAKAVAGPLGDIADFLAQHPRLIEAVAVAFGLWKTGQAIAGIAAVVDKLGAISGALRGLPAEAETAAGGISGGLGKGLGGLGFILRAGVWTLPVAIVATIIWGDRDVNPQTQTSGGPGQPQTPGLNFGAPGSTTPGFAAGPSLPPDTPLPPGFEIGPDGTLRKRVLGQHATGGAIFGAGSATSDSIPALLSTGEHVLTAAEVEAMGGHAGVYAFRQMLHRSGGGGIWPFPLRDPRGEDPHGGSDAGGSLGPFAPWWNMDWLPPEHPWMVSPSIPGVEGRWWHHGPTLPTGGIGAGIGKWFPPIGKNRPPRPGEQLPPWMLPPGERFTLYGFAGGGAVGPDVKFAGDLVGTAYDQATRHDCSGMVARIINAALGMPGGSLMSTKNAAQWLAERGFVPGIGGPGQISVGWYDHGPNPNDGHMAMTLSDGSNAEAGGGVGDIFQIGGGAAGASAPEFDQHMYLPTVYGEGPAGPASAPSSPFAGGSAVAAMTGAPAASTSSSGAASSDGGSLSLSGFPSSLSGFGSFAGGKLGDLATLGSAVGSFLDGQVQSALDVFGIGSSPGWLKGISTLIGGISIGGSGGSANPLSATSSFTGTPPPDGDVHGTRAGQPPGPGVVYNIQARDTEDMFIKAQRVERERAAAKLDRY